MRIAALLLVLMFMTPAVTRACECCPSTPHDGALTIHKAPCHGCCAEAEIQTHAKALAVEKAVFSLVKSLWINGFSCFSSSAVPKDAEKKGLSFFASSSPPPSSFYTLPLVLRI